MKKLSSSSKLFPEKREEKRKTQKKSSQSSTKKKIIEEAKKGLETHPFSLSHSLLIKKKKSYARKHNRTNMAELATQEVKLFGKWSFDDVEVSAVD